MTSLICFCSKQLKVCRRKLMRTNKMFAWGGLIAVAGAAVAMCVNRKYSKRDHSCCSS